MTTHTFCCFIQWKQNLCSFYAPYLALFFAEFIYNLYNQQAVIVCLFFLGGFAQLNGAVSSPFQFQSYLFKALHSSGRRLSLCLSHHMVLSSLFSPSAVPEPSMRSSEPPPPAPLHDDLGLSSCGQRSTKCEVEDCQLMVPVMLSRQGCSFDCIFEAMHGYHCLA